MRATPFVRAASVFFGASLALGVYAADPQPEVERGPATPQSVGTPHSLRTIPEACTRLEGTFTGDPARPYAFKVVRTSPNCRPRARFVDAGEAAPSIQTGWLLNDLIRVPRADCPGQQTVVRVWRRPAASARPSMDAQGKARIYLDDARKAAVAGDPVVPLYAAAVSMEGSGCG